jgi:hypothetical protein
MAHARIAVPDALELAPPARDDVYVARLRSLSSRSGHVGAAKAERPMVSGG